MHKKLVTVTILALIIFAVMVTPLVVFAQTSNIGVYIAQVSPASKSGPVGTAVNILGSIYSPNSSYQVVFGKIVVTTGTSEGYFVNANFTVPELASGAYPLILNDVKININYTEQFTVTTSYSVNAAPSTLQEGNSLQFNVAVSGGQPNTAYNANLTVAFPSPAGTYTKIVSLGTANSKGSASAQVAFPDSSFQPNGSVTDYVGTYTVYFNVSNNLAQAQFTINFIDSTTYHRGQTANIRATGYQPNQAATITITNSKSNTPLDTLSVAASADGVISTSWVVSSSAAIGDYTVKITPDGTQKLVQDLQTFTIPGYAVKVQTNNLAGEPVPSVVVQALDQTANSVYNATSGDDGVANLKLEKGSHVLTAFWNDVNVGQSNVTVTGEGSFTIRCQLTDLKVTVEDTNGIALPFVHLVIIYEYHTTNGGSRTGSASGDTNPSGSYTFTSVLTEATYTVNASMYSRVFKKDTYTNLPAQATSEIVITCPSESITLNVVGYNQEAISSARIELVEVTNGLFYSATTDSNGAVTNNVTFGVYRARVYKDNILINETGIQAFSTGQLQIRCTLYGIQVSVSVVDFFGSPISNANVTLNGPAAEKFSAMTQPDGIVTFTNVIGGAMQIVAYAPGTQDGYQAVTLTVDQPATVQVKIDKYVALGSLLIQASALLTIVIILIAVVLFALVEIYRRRRTKHITTGLKTGNSTLY